MLTYRLTHDPDQPELHECVHCGLGCRKCSYDEGCQACDFFYGLQPHGNGCAFSYARLSMVIGVILVPICACLLMCAFEESGYDAARPAQRNPPARRQDSAEVVQKSDDTSARSTMHSRRASGPKPLAHALREGSGRDSWREDSTVRSFGPPESDQDGPGGRETPMAAAPPDDARPFGRAASSDDEGERVPPGGGIEDLLEQSRQQSYDSLPAVVRRGASLVGGSAESP